LSDGSGEKIKDIVEKHAESFNLQPNIVKAVIMVESNGDTFAVRFEPNWRWWLNPKYWARRVRVTTRTEAICQQMSWGPMQIMGTVARELGFEQDMPALCQPATGIYYGCKKLSQLLKKYTYIRPALSAYNTGRPNSRKGRRYAEKVLEYAKRI
jgi:hypothetical protein